MDANRFDEMTRVLAGESSRRRVLKGVLVGVAAVAGVNARQDVEASGAATLTIHNARCSQALSGQAIYDACHENGFGCVNFEAKGSGLRTDPYGRATAKIGAGKVTVVQQKAVVAKSSGIYVYCALSGTNRVLFDGRADSGSVSFQVKGGDQVVCDWYNISSQDVSVPSQCNGAKRTTTTTPLPGGCTRLVEPGAGTLQTAIANSADNDVLCLSAGTYTAPDSTSYWTADNGSSKQLTIKGAGQALTFIDGGNTNGGVKSVATIVVSDLTIRNFGTSSSDYYGLWLDNGGTVTDVTIDTGYSVGFHGFGGTSTLTRVTVKSVTGTGLLVSASGTVALVASTVSGNTNSIAGSVRVVGGALSIDKDSVIQNNTATFGGGIYVTGAGTATLNAGAISGNTATSTSSEEGGGGFYLDSASTFINNGGSITGNTANGFGGGGNLSSDCTYTDNAGTVSSNTAATCAGVYNRDTDGCA